MNLSKAMTFTFAAAVVSYGISYLGMRLSGYDKKSFPEAIVTAYAKSSGEVKDVQIDRTLEVKGVELLEVTMTSTDILVKKSADDKMHVKLTGLVASNVIDLQTEQTGNKMVIGLKEDEKKQGFLNFSSEEGDMEIQVPAGVRKLALKTVSGDVEIVEIPLEDLDLKTVSGDFEIDDAPVKKVLWYSVSGDFEADAPIESFDGKSVSGDFEITTDNPTPNFAVVTTSGDLNLSFEVEPDVNIDARSVSGDVVVKTASLKQSASGNFNHAINSGKGLISFKSTSGDLTIDRD